MQVSGSRGWQGRGTPAIQLLTAEIQLPTAENKQNGNHCLRLLEIDARQPREGRHCERQNGHGRLRPEERARINSSQKSKWRVTQPFTMRDRYQQWYMPATWKATFASGSGLRGHRSSGPRWEPLPDLRLPSEVDWFKTPSLSCAWPPRGGRHRCLHA